MCMFAYMNESVCVQLGDLLLCYACVCVCMPAHIYIYARMCLGVYVLVPRLILAYIIIPPL